MSNTRDHLKSFIEETFELIIEPKIHGIKLYISDGKYLPSDIFPSSIDKSGDYIVLFMGEVCNFYLYAYISEEIYVFTPERYLYDNIHNEYVEFVSILNSFPSKVGLMYKKEYGIIEMPFREINIIDIDDFIVPSNKICNIIRDKYKSYRYDHYYSKFFEDRLDIQASAVESFIKFDHIFNILHISRNTNPFVISSIVNIDISDLQTFNIDTLKDIFGKMTDIVDNYRILNIQDYI